MALTIPDLATLEAQCLTLLRNRFPSRDSHAESFLGKTARAAAAWILGFQSSLQRLDLDSPPQSKSSTTALQNWAYLFGLSDGSGSYGGLVATVAEGLTGTITGTPAATVPMGTELAAADGTTFEATALFTVGGGGSVSGTFDATTAGTGGNLVAGDVIRFISPPVGIDEEVTITAGPTTAGIDAETPAELLERLLTLLQSPPKACTGPDYRTFVKAVSGVVEGYVYPRRDGTGSVDIVVTASGTGTARVPVAGVITAAQTHIDSVRVLTAEGVTVYAPWTAASGMAIRCRVNPSEARFDFEWDDTAASYTVDTYVAGPPTTLKLNTLAPATLKNAIDAGDLPRIQIITTGVVLPIQVRCTAWADGGGKTTLTLEEEPDTAPTPADPVYAGGPVVETVSEEILDEVDSLGPSRVGGYGDTSWIWNDTLYIDQIRRRALDALDADGVTRLVTNTITGGVTIDGAAIDKQGLDNHPTNPPELLYAKSIAVTQ